MKMAGGKTLGLLGACVLVPACAAAVTDRRGPEGEVQEVGGSRCPELGEHDSDICSSVFPQDCLSDEDGCPDPPPLVVAFPAGSSRLERGLDPSWLSSLEGDRCRLRDGVELRVVGHRGPGEPVSLALERARAVAEALRPRAGDLPIRTEAAAELGEPRVEVSTLGCEGTISRAGRGGRTHGRSGAGPGSIRSSARGS